MKFKLKRIVANGERRAELEQWASLLPTESVAKSLTAARKEAFMRLLRAASESSDPEVREALAFYQVTEDVESFLRNPINRTE